MVSFPNCKINLGLNILAKREDGYHNLETIFFPLPINDVLEIIINVDENEDDDVVFSASGLPINISSNENICVKAYYLLKKDFTLPKIKMHLHKNIPMGAGLGGGSANGAFALKMLNEKFNLNISTEKLIEYALQLGSDCPFFIINKPCFAEKRGEVMKEVTIDLSNYSFVIVNPNIHVNTGWAFKQIVPTFPQRSIQKIIQQPIDTWSIELINDFEEPVCKNYPEIDFVKKEMYMQGALYASMTGSGSTVFGIFKKGFQFNNTFSKEYFFKQIEQ